MLVLRSHLDSAYVPLEDIQVDECLNYIERPIAILDRKKNMLRNKEVGLVKVQWHHLRAHSRRGSLMRR